MQIWFGPKVGGEVARTLLPYFRDAATAARTRVLASQANCTRKAFSFERSSGLLTASETSDVSIAPYQSSIRVIPSPSVKVMR
jgi:hypothetical protein